MPHANIWFAAEEGRTTSNNNHNNSTQQPTTTDPTSTQQTILDLQSPSPSSPASSDIEIQSERTRITCPITLLPFKDPVTSTKCPHSYENAAITTMLRESKTYLPLTPAQTTALNSSGAQQARSKLEREFRKPMVQCPECVMQITSRDLRPDPALLRKVKRILERQRREEEEDANRDANDGDDGVHDLDDDEDADDLPRLSQRRKKRTVVNLGSSPDRSMGGSARKVVKAERVRDSVVPQTQFDEDEEEEDEENEEMYD